MEDMLTENKSECYQNNMPHLRDVINMLFDIEANDLIYNMYKILHDEFGEKIPSCLHPMDNERNKFVQSYLQQHPQKRKDLITKVARINALDEYQVCLSVKYPELDIENLNPKMIRMRVEYNRAFAERNKLCMELEKYSFSVKQQRWIPKTIDTCPEACMNATKIQHLLPDIKRWLQNGSDHTHS